MVEQHSIQVKSSSIYHISNEEINFQLYGNAYGRFASIAFMNDDCKSLNYIKTILVLPKYCVIIC